MNYKDLIKEIRRDWNEDFEMSLSVKETNLLVNALIRRIKVLLSMGERIRIDGLGEFYPYRRKNPLRRAVGCVKPSGKTINIPKALFRFRRYPTVSLDSVLDKKFLVDSENRKKSLVDSEDGDGDLVQYSEKEQEELATEVAQSVSERVGNRMKKLLEEI